MSIWLDITVALGLFAFYWFTDGSDTSHKEALCAATLYILYLIFRSVFVQFPQLTAPSLGQLYGALPLLSLAAILFPHFNSHSPEAVTKTLGWLGLVVTFLNLGFFQFFIW